jgi:hypothetical protein
MIINARSEVSFRLHGVQESGRADPPMPFADSRAQEAGFAGVPLACH